MKDKLDALFKDCLSRYKKDNFSPEFIERQTLIFNEAVTSQAVTEEDLKLWNKFKEIVNKKREESETNQVFFSFDHIDELGLDTDLIFVYGGKNIGKTYATTKLITKLIDRPNSKIFMLRNSRSEIDKGFTATLQYTEWPFTYTKSTGKLLRKPGYLMNRGEGVIKTRGRPKKKVNQEDLEKDPKAYEKVKYDPDHCGFATAITGIGLSSFQGPSYPDMKAIIWDECNDLGDVDEIDILRAQIFVMSVERMNKDFKVYMLGNLLRHHSGAATNIFLDYFGIPYDCNLKYFEKEGLKILYINTGYAGELYDGIKQQKFSTMYSAKISEDLNSNQPLPGSPKVLNRSFFLSKCEPELAYLFHDREQVWIMYIGQYEDEEAIYPVMKIERFSNGYNHPGYYPVTDNVSIVNQFGNIDYVKPQRIAKFIKIILRMEQWSTLFYADDNTRINWLNTWKDKLKSKYSTYWDSSF